MEAGMNILQFTYLLHDDVIACHQIATAAMLFAVRDESGRLLPTEWSRKTPYRV